MDPLLERELELAAKRKGITKSQFIIEAVERSLGRKNPYELMMALKAEEEQKAYGQSASPADRATAQAYDGYEQAYDTDLSRAQLLTKLKAKHGVGSDR
jgi:RHH-type rel operon transcriptional repressor/antitoxin RelB